LKIEFLQWKELVPFVTAESKRNFFPFRSPIIYISTPALNEFSKYTGKVIGFIERLLGIFNVKIFNVELWKIMFFVLTAGLIIFFYLNAKLAKDLDIPAAQLAIPGVTIPFNAIYGMIIAMFFHELGHAGVMMEKGHRPRDIGILLLFILPIGAAVRQTEDFEEKCPSEHKIPIYAAGVIMNLLIAFISIPLSFLLTYITQSYTVAEIMIWIVVINLGVGLMNLLAIPPLDGYLIIRELGIQFGFSKTQKTIFTMSLIFISILLLLLNLGFLRSLIP